MQRADRTPRRASACGAPRPPKAARPTSKLLAEIGQLRRSTPRCSASTSYADFQLRRRMVGSTRRRRLSSTRCEGGRRARAARTRPSCATPRRATSAACWPGDAASAGTLSYYSERLRRERYSVDQEAFRPYFPPQESLRFVMRVAETPARRAATCAVAGDSSYGTPTCRPTLAIDAPPAQPLATLYVDLVSRAKASTTMPRSGAIATARCRLHSRAPQAALVVNVGPQGPDPGRARDAAARDAASRPQQPLGHALHAAGRAPACCATSSRRRRRCSRTGSTTSGCCKLVRRGLRRPARRCPTSCSPRPSRHATTARAARYALPAAATPRTTWRCTARDVAGSDGARGPAMEGGDAARARARHASFRPASPTSPRRLRRPATTATCGAWCVALDLRTAFGPDRLDASGRQRATGATVLAKGRQRAAAASWCATSSAATTQLPGVLRRPAALRTLTAALSRERDGLQHFAGEVGQARALAARQRHVARVRPALEAVDRVGQARLSLRSGRACRSARGCPGRRSWCPGRRA